MKALYPIRTLLLMCLCLGAFTAHAQEYTYKAKVFLANREVVHGYLREPWSGGTMQLQLSEKSYITLDSLDIRKVRQTSLSSKKAASTVFRSGCAHIAHSSEYSKKRSFYHHIFAGFAFGENGVNESLGIINGYRFGDNFALGVGVNYDRYDAAAVLPIYLEPRVYLKNDRSSLYLYSDVGYGPAWMNNARNSEFRSSSATGGLMGGAGFSYQLNFAKSALTISLGYKMQKTSIQTEYYNYFTDAWGNPIDTSLTKIMDVDERRLNRKVALTLGITL